MQMMLRLLPKHSMVARSQACDLLSTLSHSFPPPPTAFPPLLKHSSLPLLRSLHQLAIILGLSPDSHISSSLLHAYAKLGHLRTARQLFDAMPHPNVVPWTALIAASDPDTAVSLFNDMRRHGTQPNSVTALALLTGNPHLHLQRLQCVHGCAIRYGFLSDISVSNCMINVYAKCGRVELARKVFDGMCTRDVVSWNSMIKGYSSAGAVCDLAKMFFAMWREGVSPDCQTFGSLVSAIANERGEVRLGRMVHGMVTVLGIVLDAHLETDLVSMYLKFGRSEDAFMVFERGLNRDVVSWTAMISGLAQNGSADMALSVFCEMMKSGVMPAAATVASVFSVCAQLRSFGTGASIHCFAVRRSLALDKAAENSLLTMYAKCGRVKQCQCVFETMQDPNLVSWNALVSAYAQNGHLDEAFSVFNRMRLLQQRPDSITMVSLLQACASVGALHHGKLAHSFIIRHEMENCISLDTSLIDMYSKCGDLETARRCFSRMPEQDVVSWSAAIGGYGSHGMGEVALKMYSDFLDAGMKPNDVMFLSVLSACSHKGLVGQGLRIFKSMKEDFGLVPRLEHYACMIDLLSRAKRLEEAYELIGTMSPKPNADVLGILLDACRMNGYLGLAKDVARDIVAMRPESAGNFIQLAHSYAAMGRWDDVVETWAQMRNLGLRKAPGWSSVELNGTITTFFADHSSYPRQEDMVYVLRIMDCDMREIRSCVIDDQLPGLNLKFEYNQL